jgi:hypothetical protein
MAETDAKRWVGMRIDGIGKRTLGRVAGLLVDTTTASPAGS